MVDKVSLRYVVFAEQKSTFTANHSIAPKVYYIYHGFQGFLLLKYGSGELQLEFILIKMFDFAFT